MKVQKFQGFQDPNTSDPVRNNARGLEHSLWRRPTLCGLSVWLRHLHFCVAGSALSSTVRTASATSIAPQSDRSHPLDPLTDPPRGLSKDPHPHRYPFTSADLRRSLSSQHSATSASPYSQRSYSHAHSRQSSDENTSSPAQHSPLVCSHCCPAFLLISLCNGVLHLSGVCCTFFMVYAGPLKLSNLASLQPVGDVLVGHLSILSCCVRHHHSLQSPWACLSTNVSTATCLMCTPSSKVTMPGPSSPVLASLRKKGPL